MNSYIEWYWDWGNFTIGIVLFLLGHLVGWIRRGEKDSETD